MSVAIQRKLKKFIMKNKDFYRAFEEKYRGSQEVIQKRLEVYVPFLLPLKEAYQDVKALDIGCGRGEWIGLLAKHDIACKGIDLDKGMLKACEQQQFDVEYGEGITYLEALESKSLMVISAFHVVEHISFEQLQRLVEESLRVLRPGGLLIMETPNPENIKVATENFYLDPTHIKPIPAKLLAFVPEYYGYKRTKVLRLQETKALMNKTGVNLLDVFNGVSPDYAIVAQKNAHKNMLKILDNEFGRNVGLSLPELSSQFDDRLAGIERKAMRAEEKIAAIWNITKPLRWFVRQVLWLRRASIGLVYKVRQYHIVRHAYFYVRELVHLLRKTLCNVFKTSVYAEKSVEEMRGELTPSAKVIYEDLKAEVVRQQGKGEG